jgi:hypothetical protein
MLIGIVRRFTIDSPQHSYRSGSLAEYSLCYEQEYKTDSYNVWQK